jgi:hypothetical protein
MRAVGALTGPGKNPVFDRAKAVGHTDWAMMAMATRSFTTPATGIVVVTITILPL